jgi:hypothetical protein
LPTVRTGHYMRPLLCFFIKKIALFHTTPHLVGGPPMPAASPSAILPDFTPRRQE